MPKAAIISHLRMTMAALGFKNVFGVTDDDVLYTVLPLYHSAGGMIGAGLMINGSTMILRDRFGSFARLIARQFCPNEPRSRMLHTLTHAIPL
jgi:acyl-CoA synthetase (AMP-forming)/AMP-acid ligase II